MAEYRLRNRRLTTRLKALFRTIEADGRYSKSIRELRREAMAWHLAGHRDVAALLRTCATQAESEIRWAIETAIDETGTAAALSASGRAGTV